MYQSKQSRFDARGRPGGHTIKIDGEILNIHFARIKHLCLHCLSPLKIKNFGLKCKENDNHYGFIHKDEAKKITQEERFMKIGEMFPSPNWRGIDLAGNPQTFELERWTKKPEKNRQTNKNEEVWRASFRGSPKRLKVTTTTMIEIAEAMNENPATVNVDTWIGKTFELFARHEEHFGKNHLCARMRPGKVAPKASPDKKPTHWSLNNSTREQIEVMLVTAGISKEVFFLANGVKGWPEMLMVKTGKEAFSKAKAYWTSDEPPSTKADKPNEFYETVMRGCEFYKRPAEVEAVIKLLSLGQEYIKENPGDAFQAIKKHAEGVVAEEMKGQPNAPAQSPEGA